MSEKSGQTTKTKDGKKYATLSLFNTYKGKSLETQKSTVAARHGLQSLGKVAVSRRMPPPANLPSIKKEHKGNDPNVSIVPKDGSGWASKQDQPEEETPPEAPPSPPPPPKPLIPVPPEVPTVPKSWASTKPGVQLNRYFQQEFPSLQAAGDQTKEKEVTDEDCGLNLRPQNVTSWRDGGAKNPNSTFDQESKPADDVATDAQDTSNPAEMLQGAAAMLKLNGQQPGPTTQYRGLMPPFAGSMFQSYPRMPFPQMQVPHRYPTPSEAGRGPRGRHPPQPQSWAVEGVERPSIVKANELKELDNLDTEADEGWAGAQSEVDYSEQLNFSDDEEQGGVPRERGESSHEEDGNFTKMENAHSKGLDISEGKKEADERPAPRKWGDIPSSQAASQPPVVKGPLARSLPQQNQLSTQPSRLAGPVRPGAFVPKPDEDEAWKQRRRQPGDMSALVERARKRREEEERRMEEKRKAACAEKLKRLNEKFGIVEKHTVEKTSPESEHVGRVHSGSEQLVREPNETQEGNLPEETEPLLKSSEAESVEIVPQENLLLAKVLDSEQGKKSLHMQPGFMAVRDEPGAVHSHENESVENIALNIEPLEEICQETRRAKIEPHNTDSVKNVLPKTEPIEVTTKSHDSVAKSSLNTEPMEKTEFEVIKKIPLQTELVDEALSTTRLQDNSCLDTGPLGNVGERLFLLENIQQENLLLGNAPHMTLLMEHLTEVPSSLDLLPQETIVYDTLMQESLAPSKMAPNSESVETLPQESHFIRPIQDNAQLDRLYQDMIVPDGSLQDVLLPAGQQTMMLDTRRREMLVDGVQQDNTLLDRIGQVMTPSDRPRQMAQPDISSHDLSLTDRACHERCLQDGSRHEMSLPERKPEDMSLPERLLHATMQPDKLPHEIILQKPRQEVSQSDRVSEKFLKDTIPPDRTRRELGPERLRRDMAPERFHRDFAASDRTHRDIVPLDWPRRDMQPAERPRRDMQPAERPRRDMQPAERPRRDMQPAERPRRDMQPAERPRRGMPPSDGSPQEPVFQEQSHHEIFLGRAHQEKLRERPIRDSFLQRQSQERPQVTASLERLPQVMAPEGKPSPVTLERPPRMPTPQERPPRVPTPQERPPRVPTPQERPPRVPTPQERPPRVPTPQERPPRVPTPQERPPRVPTPQERPSRVPTPQQRPSHASVPMESLPTEMIHKVSQGRVHAEVIVMESGVPLTERQSEAAGESESYIPNDEKSLESDTHQSCVGQDSCSEKDTSCTGLTVYDHEQETGSQLRQAVSSGYSKQFQKSLPPRFQRQQEQMKQQWQQQQQQGALSQPTQVQSQPSNGPVPPRQHRPLYQPLGPHPQHLASMGFDPRWLMMQPYMDPRMISGRPGMDMPPMHAGMISPKQLIRREQMEGSGTNSESFEHMPRPAREQAPPLPEARVMWGSEPFPLSDPKQDATSPKMPEEPDTRLEVSLDQDGTTTAFEPNLLEASNGADMPEHRETDIHQVMRHPSETPPQYQTDEVCSTPLPIEPEKNVAPVVKECSGPVEPSQPAIMRRASFGSNQSLKIEEQRTAAQPSVVKVISRPVENRAIIERTDEKPKREGYAAIKPAEGSKMEKYYKSRHDTRWGPRSGSNRREDGCERPVRRSGPIKKPVLRDMKEEREMRREKEEERLAREKGGKSEKFEKKEPLQPLPPPPLQEPEKAIAESGSQDEIVIQNAAMPQEKVVEVVPEAHTAPAILPSVVPQVLKEEKTEKPERLDRSTIKDATPEKLRLDSRLPPRREPGLPPRSFHKEARDRDWFPDQSYRGRGRGEYYSRGRSYRGSYGGRGRGGRGQSRDYPHYRDPKPRSEHLPMGMQRQREESETRSESSDFEVVPKRRRQRGSETDSDTDGRDSASDTPLSDKECVSKSKPLKRDADARKAPKPLLAYRPESGTRTDTQPRERQYIREEEMTKPGFLPKGEPMRRGRGGMYRRGGRDFGGRPPRPPPLRRPAYRDNQWIPRPQDPRQMEYQPMEPYRCEDGETRHFDQMMPADKRAPPKFERKFDPARERPRRQRPARPPRQDKPPRFRRLKEKEDTTKVEGVTGPGTGSGTGFPEPQFPDMSGKTSDLSNQNSSDQANEEWETASESSDFNERRERDERKAAASAQAAAVKSGESVVASATKRDISKRSFSSQRPGVDRQNRRGNSGTQRPGRNFSGPRVDRRGGPPMLRGKRGPFDDQTSGMIGMDPACSHAMNHHYYHHHYQSYPDDAGSGTVMQKSVKEPTVKKKDEPKPAPKKPKEKVDALSQFDLNNYASVVIIDDHPEVTTLEDSQSNLNDDGFTEVVSKKQQKRLQDEERRKKEEQSIQVWNKKGTNEKGRGQSSKLPPRFVKKQQQAALDQSPPTPPPQVPVLPQSSQLPTMTQPPVSANSSEYLVSNKTLPTQVPNTLGTEVWENKMVTPPCLNDLPKKMAPVSLPQPPSVGAWNKPLAGFVSTGPSEGANSEQESGLELGVDTIQFGAPACSGIEDEVLLSPLEKSTETMPEPKEQRQKPPRAGPIKSQKLPDQNLLENKEHKPGPIGKERSLKNRKVKDSPQADIEGQDKPSPIAVHNTDAAVVKETKSVKEMTPETGTMSASPPEFGASAKENVTDYTAPSNPLPGKRTATGTTKIEETLVSNVPLPHTLPLPRRETLQQSSNLTPASPATVDLTLKMESARKAWENSPNVAEKSSPVTSTAPPVTSVSVSISSGGNTGGSGSGGGSTSNSISSGGIVISSCASGGNGGGPIASGGNYASFSSASMPPIPVASITPTTSLSGSGTYTTASLNTKATIAADPPNICKVKPQQLQTSTMPPTGHFSQLSCMPSLITQQQQNPQVYVSQSAAGAGAQIPAFYMDTSHLFNTQHARLGPPSLAQQQGYQPGLSQQIPIPIYAPMQGQHQAQLSLGAGPNVSQAQEMFSTSLQPYRSQPTFMQNMSQPSQMVLSGATLHNLGVQHQELAKAQSNMTYQQASNSQPIPILYEHQLSQSSLGGSQLMDTHLLQARQSMGQPSSLYSGQVQQPTQTNFYNTAQSPSALQQWRYLSQVRAGPELTSAPERKWLSQSMPAEFVCLQTGRTDSDAPLTSTGQSCKNGMQGLFFNPYQKMTVPLQGSQLSLANFGSTPGQPLIALPQSLQPSPQTQHQNLTRSFQTSQTYRGMIPTSSQHNMLPPASKMSEMDLKPYGSGMDHTKPGTPPIGGRSTTPTSSPFRASSTSPNSQSSKMSSMNYQKHQFTSASGGVRIGQPFPAQFPPQMLPQPSLVPPVVRGPHANTYPAPVQRPTMPLPSQMPPTMTPGLMNHPRLHHVARGPPGQASGVRASPAHPSMKAEQDLKAKQRAEVLQSTQRFFSEQLNKLPGSKPPKTDVNEPRLPEALPSTPIVVTEKVEDKPTTVPPAAPTKPIRTGPIKPHAIKPEETKS
ncbi:protein PRRC2C isoform X3 [Ambystoma mexicanum]|uniref:protein PRRC2C isoform X3 n=1 Tax=Ambystoma mexicanum TaxID=8296 RepID=UPI0037E8471B